MANPDTTGRAGRDTAGRFKSGCSGNPNGRPKGALSLSDDLRHKLDEPYDKKRTWRQAIIDALVHAAVSGDMRAQVEVLMRIDGKVPDNLTITDKPYKVIEDA